MEKGVQEPSRLQNQNGEGVWEKEVRGSLETLKSVNVVEGYDLPL